MKTFGKTSVGTFSETYFANRKRAWRYSKTEAGPVSKLSIYLEPTPVTGEQHMKGVIYADAGSSPGALLATSSELAYHHTDRAGWYDLAFPSPIELAPGSYWLGVLTGPTGSVAGYRYDNETNSRAWNENAYSANPSNPFGAVSHGSEANSLYATYAPTAEASAAPANTAPPAISGTPSVGQSLSCSGGTWSGSLPQTLSYQWLRDGVAVANGSLYGITISDAGHALSCRVTATNSAGSAVAASVAVSIAAEAPPPSGTGLGVPRMAIDTSEWDSFDNSAWASWVEQHCAYLKAFYPRWRALTSALPVVSYRDWNANWEGTYAPLTPERRAAFIAQKVGADIAGGYDGSFIDDVNWGPGYRDNLSSHELEPEKAELANLIEGVRRAWGPSGLIEMNSQFWDIWPLMKAGDPYVARALTQVDVVTKEFGLSSNAGINTPAKFAEFLQFVDQLHARGVQLRLTGSYPVSQAEFEYEMASYFLFNAAASNRPAGRRALPGDLLWASKQKPATSASATVKEGAWWAGFDVNLGEATTARIRAGNGIWSRSFSSGLVYVNEPGNSTQTIKFGPRHTIAGEAVSEKSLSGGQGIILIP